MVQEDLIDEDKIRLIEYLKKKSLGTMKCRTDSPEILKRWGFIIDNKAELFIGNELKSPYKIDMDLLDKGVRNMIITSRNLKFYDLYDEFEKKTNKFKIFHIGNIIIGEVNLDE